MNGSFTTTSLNKAPILFKNTASRKQSCNELISRLKSRKVLGLNCDCKGETYRSKISQLLGNSETVDDFEAPYLFRFWFTVSVIGSYLFYAFYAFSHAYYSTNQNLSLLFLRLQSITENDQLMLKAFLNGHNVQLGFLNLLFVIIFLFFQISNNKKNYRFLMMIIFISSSARLFCTDSKPYLYPIETINCSASIFYFLLFTNAFSLIDRRKLSPTTIFEAITNWLSNPFKYSSSTLPSSSSSSSSPSSSITNETIDKIFHHKKYDAQEKKSC